MDKFETIPKYHKNKVKVDFLNYLIVWSDLSQSLSHLETEVYVSNTNFYNVQDTLIL